MRLLREPLFHFFLFGLAIFGWYYWMNPPDQAAGAADRIVLDAQDVERLRAQFEATWRRPPTADELQGLVNSMVRQEVLVREAQLLGLDQGDQVVRSRLAQKMDFLTTSVAQAMDPGDEALAAYLQESAEDFATRPKVAFDQVLLKPGASAKDVAEALNAGADPEDSGVPTLLPASLSLSEPAAVNATFGEGTFDQVSRLSPGEWTGPIRSGYGTHVVRLTETVAGELHPLEEIRDQVLQSWRREQSEKLTEAQIAALMLKYEIVVPDVEAPAAAASQ